MTRSLLARAPHLVLGLALAAGVLLPTASFAAIFVQIPELGACGTSTVSGFAGDIEATGVTQDVERAVDARTGLPGPGTRLFRTLTVIKQPDGCTPPLFLAGVAGQVLTLRIRFVPSGSTVASTELLATQVAITKSHLSEAADIQEAIDFGIAGTLTIIQRTTSSTGVPTTVTKCWDFAHGRAC
jgi:type VI protein secretion system component Hcp